MLCADYIGPASRDSWRYREGSMRACIPSDRRGSAGGWPGWEGRRCPGHAAARAARVPDRALVVILSSGYGHARDESLLFSVAVSQ
jgi:hypothetical protein